MKNNLINAKSCGIANIISIWEELGMTPESCGLANLVLIIAKIIKYLFMNYQHRIAD